MKTIVDLQQARAIIQTVGEDYQYKTIDLLRSLTYYPEAGKANQKAQKEISHMEKEYALNLANILWTDKFDEIPEYLKKRVQG